MLRKTNSSSSSAESLLWSSVLLWLCVIRCWSALSWCALLLLLNRSAGRSLPVPTSTQISSSSESAVSVLLCVCLLSMMALSSSSSSSSDELMNERVNEWMNRESTRSDQRFDRGTGTVEIRYASRDLSLALSSSRSFVIVYLCTSSSSKPFSLLHWRGWSVLSDQETNRFRREIERERRKARPRTGTRSRGFISFSFFISFFSRSRRHGSASSPKPSLSIFNFKHHMRWLRSA